MEETMLQYYVSPDGCDTNTGTREAPFATIDAARLAVREKITAGLTEPVTVTVLAGTYRIRTLSFTEADSGSADFPITYEAEGEVLLTGGLPLTAGDFVPLNEQEKKRLHGEAKEKVVKADLKKYGLIRNDWGEICAIGSHGSAHKYDGAVLSPMWCELFVNDTRMELARYPDKDFLYTEEVIREGRCLEPTGKPKLTYAEWNAIRNPLGDIRRIDADTAARVKNWQSFEDVWVFGYPKYNWADESTPITALDPGTRSMETTYVSIFGARERAPYYFFNVLEELDIPGEWYLDRENGILYLYPPTELENAEICLSITAAPLLQLENATDLTFRGFNFMATRSDAIRIAGERITVDRCEIKNVAGWAMSMQGTDCTVKNSVIHHTGQGGIRVSGGDRATLTSSGNRIVNNHIHHIAEIYRTYRPGVSISGVNCYVAHNCIHDSAHMAISFAGNDHVIEYNEIHSVCKIADDSSAIYAGRDYTTCGNIIRYNYFHDMSSDADSQHIGIFAVYCDDNLGSCEIYGNIMHRCQSALLLHGGHDMNFSGNLIIDRCPRTNYAIRFHAYGYWNDLIDGPESTHWKHLHSLPWQGELWSSRYPHIAEYVTWDPEKEQKNPHYCTMENNIIINHAAIDVARFNCFDPAYHNIFRNNIELPDRSFAGIPEGDTLDLSKNRFCEILPGFQPLPYDRMGLLKEGETV